MEKNNMIMNVLGDIGCLTTSDIAFLVRKRYGISLSLPSIAGSLRPYISKGYVAGSPNDKGRQVYWMTDYGKTAFKERKIYG